MMENEEWENLPDPIIQPFCYLAENGEFENPEGSRYADYNCVIEDENGLQINPAAIERFAREQGCLDAYLEADDEDRNIGSVLIIEGSTMLTTPPNSV
jgi:hypothetical protein